MRPSTSETRRRGASRRARDNARAAVLPPVHPLAESTPSRLTDTFFRNRVHLIVCAIVSMFAWPRFLGFAIVPIDFVVVPAVVLCVYQWNRLTDRCEDAINCPADLEQAIRHRGVIITACAAAMVVVTVSMVTTGNLFSNLLLVALLTLGFAYSSPSRWRLKSFFVVKNASSALGWSLLTLIYPAAHARVSLGKPFSLALAAMLVGVFSSELIWDLRDVRGDEAAGVGSLPVRFGVTPVTVAVVLLNALYLTGIIFGVGIGVIPPRWLYTATSSLLCLVAAPWLPRFTLRRWSHGLVVVQTLLLCGLTLFPAR